MKIKFIIFVVVSFCMWSCKESEPASEPPVESYNLSISGDYQIGAAGEYLETEITLAYSPEVGMDATIQVHFEVTSGGGSVDTPNQILSAQTPVVSTKWKTGTQPTQQKVTAHVYGKNRKLLTDLVYTSSALQPGKWDTVYYQRDPLENFLEMAKDPIHKKTYLIKGDQRLYIQGEHYSQWKLVESFKDKECTSIAVDSKGTLYVMSGIELFKSVDHGASFAPCTSPFSGFSINQLTIEHLRISLQITDNDHLWINDGGMVYGFGNRHSVDGGQTWIASDFYPYMDIYSLSDESLITLIDVGNAEYNFGRSIDGISWYPLPENMFQIPKNMFVTSEDEIIVSDTRRYYQPYRQFIDIYKSTDLGETCTRVYSFDITEHPTSYSTNVYIEKIKDEYYIYVSSLGIYKTKDFESFGTVFKGSTISGFMADHTGAIFVETYERYDRYGVATRYYWKDKE